MLKPSIDYSEKEIFFLNKKMFRYYQNVKDYIAFNESSKHTLHWNLIKKEIDNKKKKLKILEVGAGRTGFYTFLKKNKLQKKVHFTAHDITSQNLKFLKKNANQVIIGDLKKKMKQKFDIIFLSQVLEHVVKPKQLLDNIYNLLNNKSSIFIFCPRYDFIFYLSPTSRHLNTFKKINLILQRLKYQIIRFYSHKPIFLIHNDIAAFHKKNFFTDCDALHWTSKKDIDLWANSKKLEIEWFNLGNFTKTINKDYIVKKYLTISVKLKKN